MYVMYVNEEHRSGFGIYSRIPFLLSGVTVTQMVSLKNYHQNKNYKLGEIYIFYW